MRFELRASAEAGRMRGATTIAIQRRASLRRSDRADGPSPPHPKGRSSFQKASSHPRAWQSWSCAAERSFCYSVLAQVLSMTALRRQAAALGRGRAEDYTLPVFPRSGPVAAGFGAEFGIGPPA